LNTSKLKSSKFIKILKDSEVIRTNFQHRADENRDQNRKHLGAISQVDADLIFARITGSNKGGSQSTGRLDFE